MGTALYCLRTSEVRGPVHCHDAMHKYLEIVTRLLAGRGQCRMYL